MHAPPKAVGTPKSYDLYDTLTGKFIPWDNTLEQPVLLNVIASPFLYLPLFSSEGAMIKCLSGAKIEYDGWRMITDPMDFWESLRKTGWQVKIILDPHVGEDGMVHYVQLINQSSN